MLQFSNLTIEEVLVNQSGAMEADTISKNGRSSKSLMSRGMKKMIFIIIIVVVGLTTACDKENATDENVAKMTMTTAKEGLVRFSLDGKGTAVINWGDGTNETITFMGSMTDHSHTYINSTIRTITIIGDSITYLCCGHNPGNTGDMYNNQLKSLDVSDNTTLIYLECSNNQLTALDVSKNNALKSLGCHNNQLTALDMGNSSALISMMCSNNQLTKLDVSKNTALEGLVCNNNKLTALDVSSNSALNTLSCGNNQLTELDVSKNSALLQLVCDYNQLTDLDVSKKTTLATLDISSNLFDAERLNALFLTLHSNTVTIGDFTYTKTIHIRHNPGTATCNPNIAEEKGWDVVTTVN